VESINVELITNSPEETQDIGRILGEHALPGQIFLLIGDLGVGKTCISQGVLWGLGGEEYATSPTFVLVSEYKARLTMHHIDLYRVGSSEDMIELGLEEYLADDGISVVEWADRTIDFFPSDHLKIFMERVDETTRKLRFTTDTSSFASLLNAVKTSATGGAN